MKKINVLLLTLMLLSLIFCTTLSAQEINKNMPIDTDSISGNQFDDTEKVELKNVKINWLKFKIGFNFFNKGEVPQFYGIDPTNLALWGSTNWGIGVAQLRVNLINHYVNLKTGLEVDFNHYKFKNSAFLWDKSSHVAWVYRTDENGNLFEYDNNSLYAAYLRVPLMLNLVTNPYESNSLSFDIGVYGALKIDSRLKLGWANRELVIHDDYNLSNWTYGLTGSISFWKIHIYADYSLVGLFEPMVDNGYDIHTFSIGLQAIGF